MKIGIIGLPQAGKRTLFELLTGKNPKASPSDKLKSILGIAEIRDSRCYALAELYKPEKHTPAQIDIELLPDLDKRLIQEGDVFKDIVNLDALCLVARAFHDDSVYHVHGSVDPARDIEEINSEFILHDLVFIEKRLERIEKSLSKLKNAQLSEEKIVMEKLQAHLEKELPIRVLKLSGEDTEVISGYPFITLKELVVALNVDDNSLAEGELLESLNKKFAPQKIECMQISAKFEAEIAALDSDSECAEFMEAAGIEEPSLNALSKLCMSVLGLKSFFTVGKDEVRQWLVQNGSPAPKAARVIHTDIERGFIRAEVMKYEDLIHLKKEAEVKRAGKFYTMGKDYIVKDGDIISFLFNV